MKDKISKIIPGLSRMTGKQKREIARELASESRFGMSAYIINVVGDTITIEKDNFY